MPLFPLWNLVRSGTENVPSRSYGRLDGIHHSCAEKGATLATPQMGISTASPSASDRSIQDENDSPLHRDVRREHHWALMRLSNRSWEANHLLHGDDARRMAIIARRMMESARAPGAILIGEPFDPVLHKTPAPFTHRVFVHTEPLGDLAALKALGAHQDHPAPVRK